MALEGTIKDFGLPDIFQLIGLQRKTGILTLKMGDKRTLVVIKISMSGKSSTRFQSEKPK